MNLIQYLIFILVCKSILVFSDNILDLNKDTSNRLDLNYPTIHIVSPKNHFYPGKEIKFNLVLKNIPKSLESFTKISLWCLIPDNFIFISAFGFNYFKQTKNKIHPYLIDTDTLAFTISLLDYPDCDFQHSTKIRTVLHLFNESNLSPYVSIKNLRSEVTFNRLSDHSNQFVKMYDINQHYLSYNLKSQDFLNMISESLNLALKNSSKLSDTELSLDGMSGVQFRHFLNNIGSYPFLNYLEIGVYAGSTLFSLLKDNQVQKVVAIDSWNDFFGVDMDTVKKYFDALLPNYSHYANSIEVLNEDCWGVDISSFQDKFSVFFFDGPHETEDQMLALVKYFPVLTETFIFIVDDWNGENEQVGTFMAFNLLPVKIIAKYQILTGSNPGYTSSLWHNGVAVFIVEKIKEII